MYFIILSSAIVLALFGGVKGGECPDPSDCKSLVDCPEALLLAQTKRNEDTIQKFRKSYCGKDGDANYSFCCSNFKQPVIPTMGDVTIDNHRNQRLLPQECGPVKGDRIFGGQKADLYEFPWMALISHENRDGLSFKCGGTIINSRYILTAAHCVKNKTIAGVRLGELDINTEYDCNKAGICENFIQDVKVEKAIVHEDYLGYPKFTNDIALLRLEEDADFGHKNIDKICLPKTAALRQVPVEQKNVTVTGWGLSENGTHFSDLLKVTMRAHSEASCQAYQNRYVTSRNNNPEISVICAGELNKDSCSGDSGGPLMSEELYNNVFRYVQYGIVSNGPSRCGTQEPGIYTDIRKYMKWILDNIEP